MGSCRTPSLLRSCVLLLCMLLLGSMLRQRILEPLLPAAAGIQGRQHHALLLLAMCLILLLCVLRLLLLLCVLRLRLLLLLLRLLCTGRWLLTASRSRHSRSGRRGSHSPRRQLGGTRGCPPQCSLQVRHGSRVLPQSSLHLRLPVLCFLLCLLRCPLGPPLRHGSLLLGQQLRLAARAARQRGSTLCRLLRLPVTLRCGPAQLLCNHSVLRQPALQGHGRQPAGHSRRPGSVLLSSNVHSPLQAATAELQVLATQRRIAAAVKAAGCCCAAKRQPRFVRCAGSQRTLQLRRQGCKARD